MNEEVTLIMSKIPFCKNKQKCGWKTENNGHSAKVRLWLELITWVHIHARFEKDLLNTSTVIGKSGYEQRGCYINTIKHSGQNKVVKILKHRYTLYYSMLWFSGHFKRYDTL